MIRRPEVKGGKRWIYTRCGIIRRLAARLLEEEGTHKVRPWRNSMETTGDAMTFERKTESCNDPTITKSRESLAGSMIGLCCN